jgi:hypothetical protein
VTDRAPFYSINLPFDTGSGPYRLWKNETGTAYEFRRAGPAIERDGVTLIPMSGSLTNVPAIPAYVEQLRGQGIARSMTAEQLAERFASQGIDLQALAGEVVPELTAPQRELVRTVLSQAVPVTYRVSVETRLLVEPETGAIVSLDAIEQTLSATPDLASFARVTELLSEPPLAGLPAVQRLTGTLAELADAPPVKLFTMQYGQTPESVADFAAYASEKAEDIERVETTIPLALGILAAVALLAAGVLAVRDRRRPPGTPAAPAGQRPLTYA